MSQDSNFVVKLFFRWLVTWTVLLGWWWSTWMLFNQGQIVEGLVLGVAAPTLVTLAAVAGFAKRPSLEDDNA